MNRKTFSILFSLLLIFPLIASCQQNTSKSKFELADFFSDNPDLEREVEAIFELMSIEDRAAQMIITAAGRLGKPDDVVEDLIKNKQVGGVLLLNGSKEGFKKQVDALNKLNKSVNGLPLLYSADAEPSLFNRKIEGSQAVKKTAEIKSQEENKAIAQAIAKDLKYIGIRQNYAPVLDLTTQNAAIGNRSYGSDPLRSIEFALSFAEQLQTDGIVATVKHFPGHGFVVGDTHEKLVFIDGDMLEVKNYKPFIDAGILSIMVAHIAVKNNKKFNTDGRPASCSKRVVTELLKKEMGFEGLVITDAMNMGALNDFENATFEAVKAGCDLILMPPNETKLHKDISKALTEKSMLKVQLEQSIKKIIRLKLCLSLV